MLLLHHHTTNYENGYVHMLCAFCRSAQSTDCADLHLHILMFDGLCNVCMCSLWTIFTSLVQLIDHAKCPARLMDWILGYLLAITTAPYAVPSTNRMRDFAYNIIGDTALVAVW